MTYLDAILENPQKQEMRIIVKLLVLGMLFAITGAMIKVGKIAG